MTIKELLRSELSKRHAVEIAKMSRENPLIYDELWAIAISDKLPINWRAAWVIKGIWEKTPEMIVPYLGQMRQALPSISQHGVRREFLRILTEYPPPDDKEELGILLKCCFDWLASPMETVAVRVHSMEILFQISNLIPEIIPELKTTIEVAMQEGSAGMVSRGRRTLKAIGGM
jgi:hypothetical protein